MTTILLIIIYLAFISLGLPDSLLGAAWPVMQPDLDTPMEMAGYLFMIIAAGTIVSSLVSGRLLNRFGTGKVTFVSVLMTAGALLGFHFAPSAFWLILCAIPLGLGAGAVDAGLNNYVATHYKAHHMSWLHSFWGVGATFGPIIMAQFISWQNSWRSGYLAISIVQFILVIILFIALPLWNKVEKGRTAKSVDPETPAAPSEETISSEKPLKIKGVKLALVAFFFYCGVEATAGLWGSSFLVYSKDLSAADAARWISFYWAGITVGRFITGFITFKLSNWIIIRTGQVIAFAGAVLLLLPLPAVVSLFGFILIGLGFAPIYPCMLHETPARFGKKHSQTIMGFQMAIAYTGTTFMPPLLGFAASQTTLAIFPFFVVISVAGMLLSSEKLNHLLKGRLQRENAKPNVL